MEIQDLGFANITNQEKTAIQQFQDEYDLITIRRKNGEISRIEWLDLWLALSDKYNIPIHDKLLSLPWIQEHINKKR